MSILKRMEFFFQELFELEEIYEYHQDVEDLLQKLLKEDDIEIIDEHHVRIGDYKLWWANHPYASFSIGERVGKKYTRHKLMEKVLEVVKRDKEEQFQKELKESKIK